MNNFALYILFFIITFFQCCESRADDPDVALWLARSCIGEAGWTAHRTGECSAIWHVYRKRSDATGWPLLAVVRKYSVAVKRIKGRPNPWILDLNRGYTRPEKWPGGLRWSNVHRYHWGQMLFQARLFLAGKLTDPLPMANHFGSPIDPVPATWVRVRAGFRNWFYLD